MSDPSDATREMFSPHRLGERSERDERAPHVDTKRKVGWVPEGQPIPDGMASIPITMPNPAFLRALPPARLGEELRKAIGECATAIAAVHDFEHKHTPDGGDHQATSEVSESVRMLLQDTYGDDPAILTAMLLEMILWMALAHDDEDGDD